MYDGIQTVFVPDLSDADINNSLNGLFNQDLDVETSDGISVARNSFINLAGIYVALNCPELIKYVRFDYTAIHLMIKRFHRDAYGINRCAKVMDKLASEGIITPEASLMIREKLKLLSIRINSELPRKTRVAAAFSLWMSTFRPAYLDYEASQIATGDKLESFCGGLNFWIACMFLEQFGKVRFSEDRDEAVLLSRIIYDFTYRGINLSSLEMLYASIFRSGSQ